MNPTLTKEELALRLNGREYGEEITKAEEKLAEDASLVVVFGCSDDNVEFRGALNDEIGAYDGFAGADLLLDGESIFKQDLLHAQACECTHCGYPSFCAKAVKIEALWGVDDEYEDDGFEWTFKTEIPHATFEIMDGEEKFCRGIVFSMSDLIGLLISKKNT